MKYDMALSLLREHHQRLDDNLKCSERSLESSKVQVTRYTDDIKVLKSKLLELNSAMKRLGG